jgi:N-acetyl-anhydromuramyl-L-alanine amidase AmpD
MEGGYAGSISWFAQSRSQVSAHYCVRGDGLEATQMVHLSDRAWHACAANSRSIGIEMEGYAQNGYKPELLAAMAKIVAFLCHYLQIPVRHARNGIGPGIESHWGLGTAGGGHSDPSTDPQWMETFVTAVAAEYAKGNFPPNWEPNATPVPCRLNPPDLATIAGLQQALNALGARLDVDGEMGPATREAIAAFQKREGVAPDAYDGYAGPRTKEAILNALGCA